LKELLKVAHSASIERFGLNDTISPAQLCRRPPAHRSSDQRPEHDDRAFLVFGRAREGKAPYGRRRGLALAKYLYCAYLLAAEANNTRWKQHAGF
jgi:hypothetical protein